MYLIITFEFETAEEKEKKQKRKDPNGGVKIIRNLMTGWDCGKQLSPKK